MVWDYSNSEGQTIETEDLTAKLKYSNQNFNLAQELRFSAWLSLYKLLGYNMLNFFFDLFIVS